MPRVLNPGSIRVGKGLSPEGTVEDSSLRYPERDVDPLRVHIHDQTRSHMASAIGISDEGGCYTSENVEGALQEICGGSSSGRLNGLVSGGTFDELGNVANGSGSIATNSLTLGTPTEIKVGAGLLDVSGLVADLTGAGAGDYYVYLNTDTSSYTYGTLVVGASAPQVETGSGVEDVLLAKITYDGTNVTAWQDGRFFVRNLDRKIQYSSRQGENVDAWSEGCFATLQAFFLWMSEYGNGGTNEEEKGTILVRGTHTLTGTITVPTDYLQFVGDGESIIEGGGFAGPLVDITGRTGVSFRDINFGITGPSVTAAIQGGDLTVDLLVESCTFDGAFPEAVSINSPGSSAVNIRVLNCRSSLTGCVVRLVGVTNSYVVDLVTTGGGSGDGIDLDGCADAVVRGCRVSNYSVAVRIQANSGSVRISEGIYTGCVTGVLVENSELVSIFDNQISMASSGAIEGVLVSDSQAVSVINNQISTSGSGDYGVRIKGLTTDCKVQNNQIDGFIGGFSPVMVGVEVVSDPPSNAPYSGLISSNSIRRCSDGIILRGSDVGVIEGFSVSDNLLEGIVRSQDGRINTFDSMGTKGIGLDFCRNIRITDNTVTGMGVLLNDSRVPVVLGDDVYPLPIYTRNSDTLHITDNSIEVPVAQGNGVSEGIVVMVNGYGAPYTSSEIIVGSNRVTHDSPSANSAILFLASDPADAPEFSNVRVFGNQLVGGRGSNIMTRGIAFTSGDPFNPGDAYGCVLRNVDIRENTITDFDLAGISFTSGANPAQVHPTLFSRIRIGDNTLTGGTPTSIQRGIWIDAGSQTQSVGLSNLTVEGNTISGGAGAFGIQVHATKDPASLAAATFASVHVIGNIFPSLQDGVAIEVERVGGFGVNNRHDLVVKDNHLSSNTALSSANSGLVLDLGSVSFFGLSIGDNTFGVNDTTAWAVDISLSAPGPTLVSLEDVSFSGNKILSLGNNQPAVRFTTTRTNIDGFRISGNDLASTLGFGASAGIQSLFLDFNNSEVTAADIRRLEVENNTITGGRLQFGSTGSSLTDCSVSENTLRVSAFAEVTARSAIGISSDSDNATTLCSGFRVENNNVVGGNYGISFGMEDFASEVGTRISGNTISGLVAPASVGSIGIRAQAFNRTNINMADLRIESNSISDYTYRGIYLSLDPTTDIEARSVSVSRNTVLGTHNNSGGPTDGVAIEVYTECAGTCDTIGFQVNGNQVGPDEDGNTPYRGILFTAPSNTTSVAPVGEVSISDNVVRIDDGYGIEAHFSQVSDSPYTAYDIRLDRNQVRVLTGGDGISVEATCNFRGMSISGNEIQGITNSGMEHGIRLYHQFTLSESVADSSGTNLVGKVTLVSDPHELELNSNPFDPVSWQGLTIGYNTVIYNAEGSILNDNAAMAVSHVIAGDIAVCLWGFSLVGNTLRPRKRNSGLLPSASSNYTGYLGSMVETDQVSWPNQLVIGNDSRYIQRGWSFSGNSSEDFMRKDEGASTYHGQCVRVKFNSGVTGALQSGMVSANCAYDFDGTLTGWDEFGLTSGTNLNGVPRAF